MIRSARHRSLFLMLSLAALLGQLLLPSVHLQAQLRRGADPLLAAFCGEAAPARLAALRQQLAAKPRQRGESGAATAHLLSACPLCAVLHAAALPSPDLHHVPAAGASPPLARVIAAAASRALRLPRPPSRGPPRRA
ncbi:DUF2946 family protein [Solimonas variicoloris]|uniref:DUF2946 family protein n=1 Tax=Solimonas variicoloris TaxID=254408 RepID=UPI0003A2C687|nr:DUF2946 family protein [Solimonas variicoloris]